MGVFNVNTFVKGIFKINDKPVTAVKPVSFQTEEEDYQVPQYTVQRGNSMWQIAHDNHLSLEELQQMNPQIKNNLIHPGDKVNLDYEYENKIVNLREEEALENEWNKSNESAIHHARHDSNYALVDKAKGLISVFDKSGNLLYESNGISTGANKSDYNTVTYQGRGGIENYAGNNSTPAGILKITGRGEYHGSPSFTRARFNPETGKPYQVHPWVKDKNGNYYQDTTKLVDDNVASSIHFGSVNDKKSSNGCIRANRQTLEDLSKLLGVGDTIYTLPENSGSRFSLKGGKLNFIADNPYGNTEKGNISESGHDMVNWDDYNVHIDKSYSPLVIKPNKTTNNSEHDQNAIIYGNTISTNKQSLQKQFNLTSQEYNKLAQLAMGIAEQESEFGTGMSLDPRHNYKLKTALPGLVSLLKGNEAQSRGYGQIKLNGDNKDLQKIYQSLGVNEKSILTPQGSAIAVMARLAYIYNTEVKGRNFTGGNNEKIDAYDALLYKWNGRNEQLTRHLATPRQNSYINNIKKYLNNYDYYEQRRNKK